MTGRPPSRWQGARDHLAVSVGCLAGLLLFPGLCVLMNHRDGGAIVAWVVVGSATLLLWAGVAHLRDADQDRRRAAENRCLACGYDLRGNVSGVCPECGTRTGGPRRMT